MAIEVFILPITLLTVLDIDSITGFILLKASILMLEIKLILGSFKSEKILSILAFILMVKALKELFTLAIDFLIIFEILTNVEATENRPFSNFLSKSISGNLTLAKLSLILLIESDDKALNDWLTEPIDSTIELDVCFTEGTIPAIPFFISPNTPKSIFCISGIWISSRNDADPPSFKVLFISETSLDTSLFSFLVWPGIFLNSLPASLLAIAIASNKDTDPPLVKILFIFSISLATALFSFLVDLGILFRSLLASFWDKSITSSNDIGPVAKVLFISFTSEAIALLKLSVESGILSNTLATVSFICPVDFSSVSWPLTIPLFKPSII